MWLMYITGFNEGSASLLTEEPTTEKHPGPSNRFNEGSASLLTEGDVLYAATSCEPCFNEGSASLLTEAAIDRGEVTKLFALQ